MKTALKLLRTLPKTWGWAYVIAIFGVVTWWMTYESPANLRVYITAKARVYDLHADVPGLAILFDGQDIKEKRQVLSFYTLRFTNEGDRPITQNMYDGSIPFGITWSRGKVFPPEILEVSQKYLKDRLQPSLRDEKTIEFKKVVLDARDYFMVRVLVLHDEGSEPEISPTGKIAGIDFDKVQVVDWSNKPDFWTSVKEKGFFLLLVIVGVSSLIGGVVFAGIAWMLHKLKKIEPQINRIKNEMEHATALMKITTDYIEDEQRRIHSKLSNSNDSGGDE